MNNVIVDRKFVSFDGGVRCSGYLVGLSDRADLARPEIEALFAGREHEFIPRGASLSFCAASFDESVIAISTSRLDKIVELNQSESSVTVESGVTVGDLLDFLVQRGYFLPVVPGYQTITIGGCIAADVHGKNQLKDGNFHGRVQSIVLHHADHGILEVSRADQEDLFELTLGGLGLTGTILSATLRVSKLPSATMKVVTEPIDDILKLPGIIAQRAADSDFIVSWHDFQQVGSRFGHGHLEWGKFSERASGERDLIGDSQTVFPIKHSSRKSSLLTLTADNRGFNLPNLYGLATSGLMNSFYDYLQRTSESVELPLSHCFFPNKFWRDIYFHSFGRHGLIEHQIVMAPEKFPHYIGKLEWWLNRNDLPITIASSKMFAGEQKLLRFGGAGVCFALDFPRCARGFQFLKYLDELTVELGGTPNIFKDSRLPLRIVEATYPQYGEFRRRLHDFDSHRRYQSELSRRLGL